MTLEESREVIPLLENMINQIEEQQELMARRRDLNKLKRQELLEIMLAQGREIDRLREQVADLQEQLDDRTIAIEKAGSIAKASLALTKVFEEAQKAADLYLYNVSGGRDGKGGSSKGWEHGRED